MADSWFIGDKPLTLNCDLDLEYGNINFMRDTLSHFALSLCSAIGRAPDS